MHELNIENRPKIMHKRLRILLFGLISCNSTCLIQFRPKCNGLKQRSRTNIFPKTTHGSLLL